jgi:hypothetical protein
MCKTVVLSAERDKVCRVIVCLKSKTDFMVDFLGRFVAAVIGTLFSVFFMEKFTRFLVLVSR